MKRIIAPVIIGKILIKILKINKDIFIAWINAR